jgi:acyl-CoA synthetase (AMP-forming)/AMP-acid ligase II
VTYTASSGLSARINDVLSVDREAPAIEFEGSWWTWGQLGDTVIQAVDLVSEPGAEVGILLRNRPVSIGLVLGVLSAGGCVVTINPGRGRDRTQEDIAGLDLRVLAGEPDDVAELVPAASRASTASATELGTPFAFGSGPAAGAADNPVRPGVAVRVLTSGTTGTPKRVDLSYRMIQRVLVGAKHYETNRDETIRLRRGVAIVNSPLVHLGGLFRVLQCISD